MKHNHVSAFFIATTLCLSTGCGKKTETDAARNESGEKAPVQSSDGKSLAPGPKPVQDPVLQEITKFRAETRPHYNNSNFDKLEKIAEEARAGKGVFDNGSWKIYQFYTSLTCREEEPEEMWQLHDRIHLAWTAAKPDSITAKIAHADFFVAYAWHARGHGYADKVTKENWKLFATRLTKAVKILDDAKKLQPKDPYFWTVLLAAGQGLGWEKENFDAIVAEAVAQDPCFFSVDQTRANMLLPRWFGQPGDWEAYAQQASERPNGLGAEIYARIVMHLSGYYDNVFSETKASWPRTREGLLMMRKKYPKSIEILSMNARMAAIAGDREFARESFDLLGDQYLSSVWQKPDRFVSCRTWAQTGK
jgi:hypothetical protein